MQKAKILSDVREHNENGASHIANNGFENYELYIFIIVMIAAVLFFISVISYNCCYGGIQNQSAQANNEYFEYKSDISEHNNVSQNIPFENMERLNSLNISTKTDEEVTEILENAIETNPNNFKYFDEKKYEQEKINVYKTEAARFLTHLQI